MVGQPSAAVDLGLGDGEMLRAQLDDEETRRKKKMLAMDSPKPGQYGDSTMGLAAMTLGLGVPHG